MSKNEIDYAGISTVATIITLLVATPFAADKVTDVLFDAEVENNRTEYSETVISGLEETFNDLLEQKRAITELAAQQNVAYSDGDKAALDDLAEQIASSSAELEGDYTRFVYRVLTNESVPELTFNEFAERAAEVDFPSRVDGTIQNEVMFNPGQAKYIDACRVEAKDGYTPLQANTNTAEQVSTCAVMAQAPRGLASIIASLGSLWLMLAILGPGGAGDAIENGYRSLYRRRSKTKKLENN